MLPILLIVIIFVTGCTQQSPATQAPAKVTQSLSDICIQACKDVLTANKNLDAGPCLLDPFEADTTWVCDVAHNPRLPIDNLPKNQCKSFRNGTAQHFIEVTPDCKIIKTQ